MQILKKSLSVLLILAMLLTVCSGLCISTYAAETSVKIVSFVRGETNDLRSSELLEARVEGYDGNISDLVFNWDNQLSTYLYIYNSSNMYNIKDTAGEIEITGKTTKWVWEGILPSRVEVAGENVSATGYAWAAVYGADLNSSSLVGTITVTVTDKEGNLIGTASYSDFEAPSLSADLEDTNYGVFEGEEINIKDMLGRSSIVHIDCSACEINGEPTVVSGESCISISENSSGEYIVEGLSSGVAEISLSLQKNNCKFHQYSGEETITNKVYVFKAPVTSTTTTTLTLTELDANCEYFIGNVKGERNADETEVVFTGLQPNTNYEVTVRGDYGDGYAYAYVTDQTKPVYRATVNFYTNDYLADTLEFFGVSKDLFLKEANGSEYISLTKNATGVYIADVENGIYYIYHKNGEYTRFGNYQITIDNENNSIDIHTYSVAYNLNGGEIEGYAGSVHQADTAVYVTEKIPTKSNAVFLYWEDADGNQYKSGQLLTERIKNRIELFAIWEDSVDVKVNITINHGTDNAGVDNAQETMHNVDFRLLKIENDTTIPAADVVSLTEDSCAGYDYLYDNDVTTYTSNTANFEGLKGASYTISSAKSNYDLVSVNQTTQEDGTIILDMIFQYEPNNFDLTFDVVMNSEVPEEFYPAGVNVKVKYWGYNENSEIGWHIITQQADNSIPPTYVAIGEDGKGSGSYPVWKTWSEPADEPYFYSIEVISYVLDDGSVVQNNVEDGFVDVISVVNGGGYPEYPDGSSSEYTGAYFDATTSAQNGVPTATISIESFNLTFDANGGKIEGNDTLILEKQVIIPDTLKYVPTKDGGYMFTGWYTDSTCTTKVVSGTRIKEDTTIYAGWRDPLTVSGTVTVEAFYDQNGTQIEVLDVDRASEIVVTLQVINNNSSNDIMSTQAELVYNSSNIATINYEFTNIADSREEGVEYRIRTALINYKTLYNNDGDETFTSDEYKAVFADKTATVDANLVFEADVFSQNYEVDATAIGDGYRPVTGMTQVLFGATGSATPNTVISQHSSGGGETLNFVDGVANGSIDLWKGSSNGTTSTYQLLFKNFNDDEYTDASPYTVRYGSTTSWDVSTESAGTLKATLIPREYHVVFNLNAESDVVGGMDEYESMTEPGTYFTTHTWSYNTVIGATPTREGYVFVGWEASEDVFDGKNVLASVQESVTLNAVWAEFKWTTDKDSGYIKSDDGKKSVVRFLFDVVTTDEISKNIEKTGIKYIKTADITGDVGKSTFAGEDMTGTNTTFYGDITDIPESKAGEKYLAVAYIVVDGETYWSESVECGPDFEKLIKYD